jgi:hypothetical protein
MINLKLTTQESILLYGSMKGILDALEQNEQPLKNPELSKSLVESIAYKILTELENQTTNN